MILRCVLGAIRGLLIELRCCFHSSPLLIAMVVYSSSFRLDWHCLMELCRYRFVICLTTLFVTSQSFRTCLRSNWVEVPDWLSLFRSFSNVQINRLPQSFQWKPGQCSMFCQYTYLYLQLSLLRPLLASQQNYTSAAIRGDPGGVTIPQSPPLMPHASNLVDHYFIQFGKQHSRYKAILPSVVLSQQCCEVYFISPTAVNLQWDLQQRSCYENWLPNLTEMPPSP